MKIVARKKKLISKMVSRPRVIRSLLALPFVVLFLIPAMILIFEERRTNMVKNEFPMKFVLIIISFLCLLIGISLFITSNRLLIQKGKGTLAPWDPPKEFVASGPYLHVRNPMILGVILMLIAEAIFFLSPGILRWALIFIGVNLFYIPFIEEKALIKRFGDCYKVYREKVPGWIPRVTPCKGNSERG